MTLVQSEQWQGKKGAMLRCGFTVFQAHEPGPVHCCSRWSEPVAVDRELLLPNAGIVGLVVDAEGWILR